MCDMLNGSTRALLSFRTALELKCIGPVTGAVFFL